jgi:hypothetical protein
MNTNDPWIKLSGVIRRGPPERQPLDAPVPLGFCSRVLARLRPQGSPVMETWFQLSVRALPVAAAVLLVCWLSLPAPGPAGPAPDSEAVLVEMALAEALP